jgi:hypothetical protein
MGLRALDSGGEILDPLLQRSDRQGYGGETDARFSRNKVGVGKDIRGIVTSSVFTAHYLPHR